MDGKFDKIIFTPYVDDICRPCNQLDDEQKCIQCFDEETTKAYGTKYKQVFNYQLDMKLNEALPDIFIFDNEQEMIDVLNRLNSHLTNEIITLYLWKRPDREKKYLLRH